MVGLVLGSHSSCSVIAHNPDLVIMSDASETDWIAVMEDIAMQGFRSQDEVKLHIDQLELRAAGFGFQAFMKNKHHLHIHLRMDNKMVVAHVNKQRGTR